MDTVAETKMRPSHTNQLLSLGAIKNMRINLNTKVLGLSYLQRSLPKEKEVLLGLLSHTIQAM